MNLSNEINLDALSRPLEGESDDPIVQCNRSGITL